MLGSAGAYEISGLPVVDPDGALIGIFSERDVLRGLHHRGDAYRNAKIGDVMTRDPAWCEPTDDVEEVMSKMSERHIAKVPVIENDRVTGVISVGDVIKLMAERLKTENHHLLNYLYGTA